MNTPTITRRLCFEAGHRVLGHESKCANAHGHSYVVYIEADGTLDQLGRVIDFSVLKELIGGWLDRHWDHGFILFRNDLALTKGMRGQKLYLLNTNPTAENMAAHLLHEVCPALLAGTGVTVIRVTLRETENCEATAWL